METWSALKKQYKKVILTNAHSLGYVESALRGLLIFAPGKLRESDVVSESAYTVLDMLCLFNDMLMTSYIQKRIDKDDQSVPKSLKEIVYLPGGTMTRRLVVTMSIVQNLELLIEIIAHHNWSPRTRWIIVFIIELLKVIIRLLLLHYTKEGILVHDVMPDRNDILSSVDQTFFSEEEIEAQESKDYGEKRFKNGRNQRKTLLTEYVRNSPGQRSPILLRRPRTPDDSSTETQPIFVPTPSTNPSLQALGEYLYILRPLMYLIALALFSRKSWIPWLVSLGIDIGAMACTKKAASPNLNEMEQSELTRRFGTWLYYLLRSPFFEVYLQRGRIAKIVEKLKSLPGLQGIITSILEYVIDYREYYFYTSASSTS